MDTLTLKKRIYDLAISGQLTCHLVDDTPVDSTLLFYQEEGVDSLPDIPDTWKYCYFDDVLINRDSERIPVSVADRKKLSKKYDYYGASGVIDKVDNFLFDENLLLIGEDGANLLSRSTPIAFIAKGKYWVNNHAHVLQATEHVLLEFVEIYINAISLVPYVTGSAQPKLSQRMMSKIPVPVPPIEEQQRIVETVRSVSEHLGLIDALQSQYQDNLATLKQCLPFMKRYGKPAPEMHDGRHRGGLSHASSVDHAQKRDQRITRSVPCGHDDGGRRERGGRSWWTCGHGNHAPCCAGAFWADTYGTCFFSPFYDVTRKSRLS